MVPSEGGYGVSGRVTGMVTVLCTVVVLGGCAFPAGGEVPSGPSTGVRVKGDLATSTSTPMPTPTQNATPMSTPMPTQSQAATAIPTPTLTRSVTQSPTPTFALKLPTSLEPKLPTLLPTPLPTLIIVTKQPTANVLTPTPRVPTCAQGGRCNVGEQGPGGGIVFFANRGEFICGPQRGQVCRYLEAAPVGWNGTREDAFGPWCAKQGDTWPNVYTNEGLGWGLANTQTIARACGPDSAAGRAAAYRGGGRSDWHLPSKAEVDALSQQRAIVGAPLLNYCWSSSQAGFSETGAWLLNFSRRQWEITYKDFPHSCIRPIRAF